LIPTLSLKFELKRADPSTKKYDSGELLMNALQFGLTVSLIAGSLVFLSRCGTTQTKSSSKEEGTTEQPTDVAGGFGLTCSPSDNPQDATKTDFSCVFTNQKGDKFNERPNIKLLVEIKVADQVIPFALLGNEATSNFTFTIAKSDGEKVQVGAKLVNPLDGNKSLIDKSSSLTGILSNSCSDSYYDNGILSTATQTTELPGPDKTVLSLQEAGNGFKVWKEKGGSRLLNATGCVSRGWQQTLNRRGTAFSDYFTDASKIGGRVCPANVYLNYSNPLATSRCLYYDIGHPMQTLDASSSGNEAEDWLKGWDRSATEGGSDSSYYEGNIRTCADIGMRLPVLYETQEQPIPSRYLPSQNLQGNKPIYMKDRTRNPEILKFYSFVPPVKGIALVTNPGVEHFYTWTATAANYPSSPIGYFTFTGRLVSGEEPSAYVYNATYPIATVRCVLPSH